MRVGQNDRLNVILQTLNLLNKEEPDTIEYTKAEIYDFASKAKERKKHH